MSGTLEESTSSFLHSERVQCCWQENIELRASMTRRPAAISCSRLTSCVTGARGRKSHTLRHTVWLGAAGGKAALPDDSQVAGCLGVQESRGQQLVKAQQPQQTPPGCLPPSLLPVAAVSCTGERAILG